MNKIEKRSDLYREWARVLDMIEITSIKPQDCVKIGGTIYTGIPDFRCSDIAIYQFAIAIVEDRPVFVGDELYWKSGFKIDVHHSDIDINGIIHIYDKDGNSASVDSLSWNPPKPKTLCVIEGKDVFVGSLLYIDGFPIKITDGDEKLLRYKPNIISPDRQYHGGVIVVNHPMLSWHENKPKTFNLNGVELDDRPVFLFKGEYHGVISVECRFNIAYADRNKLVQMIYNL